MAQKMQCIGCGLEFNAARYGSGFATQTEIDAVDPDQYAHICLLVKECGRAPAILQNCPYLRRTIDAVLADMR
jgi:Fe-S-cluster-containing hydrogenase component 2